MQLVLGATVYRTLSFTGEDSHMVIVTAIAILGVDSPLHLVYLTFWRLACSPTYSKFDGGLTSA